MSNTNSQPTQGMLGVVTDVVAVGFFQTLRLGTVACVDQIGHYQPGEPFILPLNSPALQVGDRVMVHYDFARAEVVRVFKELVFSGSNQLPNPGHTYHICDSPAITELHINKPGILPDWMQEPNVAVRHCYGNHEWVDTGMRWTFCKYCNAEGDWKVEQEEIARRRKAEQERREREGD